MKEHIRIGFSPCPNDTFIFDALVNKKIDTGSFEFTAVLEDVETLNSLALKQTLAVTKLSYGVLPLVLETYNLLDAGSALGRGVGPLLVRNKNFGIEDMFRYPVAIPGEHTTAHLLFSMAYPEMRNKIFMRYDEIENFVSEGQGLGVIIHESRFTYKDKGLDKITDLGNYWETETGKPIPLGGIVIDKKLTSQKQSAINTLIKNSLKYAFANYPVLPDFVKDNAQEMNEEVMRSHIDLYVNQFSLTLGEQGRDAIRSLLKVYNKLHNNIDAGEIIFVNSEV